MLPPQRLSATSTKALQSFGILHTLAMNGGLSEIVLRDILLGGITIKSTGDDTTGYRVLCQMVGGNSLYPFVIKEDGAYRVVGDGQQDTGEFGHYILYALDHNQPALAKSILDWKRGLLHKGGGDDPFSGDLLPRFWTVGSTREGADSPESMRVAAISLLTGSMGIKPYLDSLIPLRDKATGARQTDLDALLLAS